jgi:hypothetical protein
MLLLKCRYVDILLTKRLIRVWLRTIYLFTILLLFNCILLNWGSLFWWTIFVILALIYRILLLDRLKKIIFLFFCILFLFFILLFLRWTNLRLLLLYCWMCGSHFLNFLFLVYFVQKCLLLFYRVLEVGICYFLRNYLGTKFKGLNSVCFSF